MGRAGDPGIVLRTRVHDNAAGPVVIEIEGAPQRELRSSWTVLDRELYRTEGGYEVHFMLTNGNRHPYLTLECREIEWAYLPEPD